MQKKISRYDQFTKVSEDKPYSFNFEKAICNVILFLLSIVLAACLVSLLACNTPKKAVEPQKQTVLVTVPAKQVKPVKAAPCNPVIKKVIVSDKAKEKKLQDKVDSLTHVVFFQDILLNSLPNTDSLKRVSRKQGYNKGYRAGINKNSPPKRAIW